MALKVNDQSSEVIEMAAEWPIVEALLGGTTAMRAAGTAFLPKWPNEADASYEARRTTATLFPALARTISVMSGKPFAKQLTLGEDVPDTIRGWCDDADLQGNNLHSFAADVFDECLGYGIAGVLVDYPTVNRDQVRNLEQERAIGARPYTVFIRHKQMLGWKSMRVGGATMLTQLRIAETAEVDDGGYGTACVNRVRVLTPGAFELFEENDKKEWVSIDRGTTTLQVIPFVPFYGKRKGFMCGVSPLIDLAYLNVKHWQSQSDQDTIMHVARVPVLVMIGVDNDSPELTVGSSSATKLPSGADMKYVEHSGAAIDAGAKSLESLEEHMIQTGAELVVKRPGQQRTATQDDNEAEANKSDLQRIVEAFEDSIDQVLQLMAMWVKEPQGGHASLFKDFGASTLSDASAQLVVSLQQAGLISKVTAIKEQQRRGMLAADIDPEDELADIGEEGPALGAMGLDPLTGLPTDPLADPGAVDPVTGKPKPGASAPGADPLQPKEPADPPINLAPLVEALQAMADKMGAEKEAPETPPLDWSPIVEAIKAIPAPTVNVPAAVDITPFLQSVVDSLNAIKAMPAPVVNMPAIQVDAPSIQVDAPQITLPAPAPAPIPPPPAPRQLRQFEFVTDSSGEITGARELGPDGRAIDFTTNADGTPTGARMT